MDKDYLGVLNSQMQMQSVMKQNEKTKLFGITITEEDAKFLVAEQRNSLKEKQRVEFGTGIIPRLMDEFCDSAYIDQDNFVETISRLQDIFYEYKNESLDALSDDELVAFMKEVFEGTCQGSCDYLEETILEEFARNIREQGERFLQHYYKVREIEDE